MFLLVRRQHQALHTEFCLARCRRMYNIFHPYDPVAYRYKQTLLHICTITQYVRSHDPQPLGTMRQPLTCLCHGHVAP